MRTLCLLLLSAFVVVVVEGSIEDDGIGLPTITIDKEREELDLTSQIRAVHMNYTWAVVPFQKQDIISSDVLIILEVADTDGDITVYTSENALCDPTRDTGFLGIKYVHALYKTNAKVVYFCIHKQTPETQSNYDRFIFYTEPAQEVEYGDRFDVECKEQESPEDTYRHVMYLFTKMPSPKETPSVEVVLDSAWDNLLVLTSVNVYLFALCDNLTLEHRPPVDDDFQYTSEGESQTSLNNKIYEVIIEQDLETGDVVYTRVECPIKRYDDEEILSYTYSIGATPIAPTIVGSVFGGVFGLVFIIMIIGCFLNKPFEEEVQEQDMFRIRHFLCLPGCIMCCVAIPMVIAGSVVFAVSDPVVGGPILGAGGAIILVTLICCGPSVFTLNKTTDEFVITKHYLITVPRKKVYKLSEVDGFDMKKSIGKHGKTIYTMVAKVQDGKLVPLETGASNINIAGRADMIAKLNNFVGTKGEATVDQKLNTLREMDSNGVADYLVKHPEDNELVAQVMKEKNSNTPV